MHSARISNSPHTRGKRAFAPGQEVDEKPLLLNIRTGDPSRLWDEHLQFSEFGTVSGKSEEGKTTVQVIGLNREALVVARKTVWKDVQDKFYYTIQAVLHRQPDAEEKITLLKEYEAGRLPFSATARAALAEAKKEARKNLSPLGFLIR